MAKMKSKTYKTFTGYKKSLLDFHYVQIEEKDESTSTTIFYEGIEKYSQRKVFIKKFNKKFDNFNEFQAESFALDDLNQKNIIKPIATFEDKKFGYIVFPYAEGGDLFDLTRNERVIFDNSQLKIMAFALLSALEKIHSKGYIYRDLKLENIVFLRKIEEMLFDFNPNDIQLIDLGSIYIESKSASLINFRGTTFYRPPEYIFHQKVTDKYDIFSLGIILYFLAVAYLPFNPNYNYDEIEMMEMFSENKIDALFEDEDWNNVSDDIKKLIKSMLLFDDNMRPSAKELLKNRLFDDLLSPYEFMEDDEFYSIC